MIEKLEEPIKQVFLEEGYDVKHLKVSVSNRPELCDYQINSVFALAKERKANPIEIGENLTKKINQIDNFSNYFKEVVFVKPGFINLTISDKFIKTNLDKIKEDKDLGIRKIDKSITCVLDYGGPNIAKPLHVGHIRTAIIGQSIYEILKVKGYKVLGDIHLGDIGLQMGQVIYGLINEGLKPEEITMDILQKIYPKVSALCKENEEVKAKCQVITKELQEGNIEYNRYFNVMYDVSVKDIKRLYGYLGVSFDYWYGEKDSYKYLDELMDFLYKQGVVEEDSGAKVIKVKEDTDKKEMPPLLLQNKNGAYLYAASDVATIYQRMKDFNPDYILYIVDERQRLHFEQVFRACKKSKLTKNTVLEHDYNGTMNGPDGKPFKTRSGETLKLEDLINKIKEIFISKKESNKNMKEVDLDIIVNSILKFADLQNNREKNYIFDIDKFADINGKTGPYILYTNVRIRKIINENKISSNEISEVIYNDNDRKLRKKLLELDDVVTKACNERMPHYIADYLYDLAVLTNSFYQNNNISKLEDKINKDSWLNLLKVVYLVNEKLLSLLMIKIPSEM